MSGYGELVSLLGKLKRNEEQMSPEQREEYAGRLEARRKRIRSLALAAGRQFMFMGVRILEGDSYALDQVRSVLSENEIRDAERAALAVLFSSYDLDDYLTELLPVQLKIYYLGYGPYWAAHCKPVKDKDDEAEFTYYNNLIGMYWCPALGEWKRKNEWAVTLRLPPTMELIREEYRREVENVFRRREEETGPGRVPRSTQGAGL